MERFWNTRAAFAGRTEWGHHKGLLVNANQQVGLREMLETTHWSNSPLS